MTAKKARGGKKEEDEDSPPEQQEEEEVLKKKEQLEKGKDALEAVARGEEVFFVCPNANGRDMSETLPVWRHSLLLLMLFALFFFALCFSATRIFVSLRRLALFCFPSFLFLAPICRRVPVAIRKGSNKHTRVRICGEEIHTHAHPPTRTHTHTHTHTCTHAHQKHTHETQTDFGECNFDLASDLEYLPARQYLEAVERRPPVSSFRLLCFKHSCC